MKKSDVTISNHSTENGLNELNSKFHSKQHIAPGIYQQLMKSGFLHQKSFLVAVFPDGSNTYCGKIIKENGLVFNFDIDNPSSSSFSDITEDFMKKAKAGTNSREAVSLMIFKLMSGT